VFECACVNCNVCIILLDVMSNVCESALQHTATYCDILQHTVTHCNTLHHTATHCNTLQHDATYCNTLQHTATRCSTLQYAATHCNTLQHTATHCNTLQHTSTHCHTLQHTATHCMTVNAMCRQICVHISISELMYTHTNDETSIHLCSSSELTYTHTMINISELTYTHTRDEQALPPLFTTKVQGSEDPLCVCHPQKSPMYPQKSLYYPQKRPLGCLNLQVITHKRATNHWALLQRMTCGEKASYGSTPPCSSSL